MGIKIRNWEKYQHYKFRRPPWIKLHKGLLDDQEFHQLSADSARSLIFLWLVASEANGELPDMTTLAFRLRTSEDKLKSTLSDLSAWLEQDASATLAPCKQDATTEKSREEKSRDAHFASFWTAYPKRVGKEAAERSWNNIKPDEALVKRILEAVNLQKKQDGWVKDGGKFIPYPATWLNQRRWEDEVRDNRRSSPFWDKVMGKTDGGVRKEPQLGGLPEL